MSLPTWKGGKSPSTQKETPNRLTRLFRRLGVSNRYQYLPLNDENKEIRVLHLLPGNFSDPINIALEILPFGDDNIPYSEALSYCWGSTTDPMHIFIGENSEKLSVTSNLGVALPHLRRPDTARTLWIDAICVNQRDLEERSQQVRRMADIYSNAHRVVVWLGPKSNDSDIAMDCIEKISSHIEVEFQALTMRPASDEVHWADIKIPLALEVEEFRALSNFLTRDWFERLGSCKKSISLAALLYFVAHASFIGRLFEKL